MCNFSQVEHVSRHDLFADYNVTDKSYTCFYCIQVLFLGASNQVHRYDE